MDSGRFAMALFRDYLAYAMDAGPAPRVAREPPGAIAGGVIAAVLGKIGSQD